MPTAEGLMPTVVKGLLQRARVAIPSSIPAALPGAEAGLAREFAEAFTADDVEVIVALLTDKAWLVIPPATERYERSEEIAAFLRASWPADPAAATVLPTRAGGRPAFGCYLSDEARDMLVLTPIANGNKIFWMTRFLADTLHRHFASASDTHP